MGNDQTTEASAIGDPTSVSRPQAALAGLAAAIAALGASELVAGLFADVPSLLLAIGDAVIDIMPGSFDRRAIDLFGTSDKSALIIGTVIIALALGAVLGIVARRWFVPAAAGFVLFAVLGVSAALGQGPDPGDRSGDRRRDRCGHRRGRPARAAHRRDTALPGAGTGRRARPTEVPDLERRDPRGRRAGRTRGLGAQRSATGRGDPPGHPTAPAHPIAPTGSGGDQAGRRRNHPAVHAERRLLPGRHGPSHAGGGSGPLAPGDPRGGGPALLADLPGAPRPAPGRSRHHPGLRVQRGRRQPGGQRPVAGCPLAAPAAAGRRATGRQTGDGTFGGRVHRGFPHRDGPRRR